MTSADRRFLLSLGLVLILVVGGHWVARPFYAVATVRDAYLSAATDCFEARSTMADLEGRTLAEDEYRLAYRTALVPAMACLEKTRIETWLAELGVTDAVVTSLSLEALNSAEASLGSIAGEFGLK